MWLPHLLVAIICSSVLTSARPLTLPRPDSHSNPTLVRREEESKEPGFRKYFHEPGYSIVGAHYDSRYYVGENNYQDRRLTQMHMLRAYFRFFGEKNMETWIAHGTLLGWWWNGKMLPWDWDIDTQVSEATLKYMGLHHNRTMYEYVAKDDPSFNRTYLLDVNMAIVERERGNGNNVIDARFIDTTNGLYIDITGLSETRPEEQPGIWSCKNYHRYHTTDLYPMRETVFEGVTAKVPYAYDRLLTQEYSQKALVLTEYEGHRWNTDLREWIKKSDDEIKAEKEALKAAKTKQRLAKQRLKAEKLRQKQEKLKEEEAERNRQAEAAKEDAARFAEANKQEAAKPHAALAEEPQQKEGISQGNNQQVNTPSEKPQPPSPQPNLPQSEPPAPNVPQQETPQPNLPQSNPPTPNAPQPDPPQQEASAPNPPAETKPEEKKQQIPS